MISESGTDVRRVAFVAERFTELQGLRRVVDGGSLLLLWTLMRLGSPQESAGAFMTASFVWVVATMWASASVIQYYRDRFGRTEPDGNENAAHARAYVIYRLLIVSAAFWIGGWFALLLPILTVRAGYVVYRDWPYRQQWLLLVLVGAAFSLAYLAVDSRFETLEWQWRFIWTAAPSLIVVGLLDHRLLVRSMARPIAASVDTHHANTV